MSTNARARTSVLEQVYAGLGPDLLLLTAIGVAGIAAAAFVATYFVARIAPRSWVADFGTWAVTPDKKDHQERGVAHVVGALYIALPLWAMAIPTGVWVASLWLPSDVRDAPVGSAVRGAIAVLGYASCWLAYRHLLRLLKRRFPPKEVKAGREKWAKQIYRPRGA